MSHLGSLISFEPSEFYAAPHGVITNKAVKQEFSVSTSVLLHTSCCVFALIVDYDFPQTCEAYLQ